MEQLSTMPADPLDASAGSKPANSSGCPTVVPGHPEPATLLPSLPPRQLEAKPWNQQEGGRSITLDVRTGIPTPTMNRLIIPFEGRSIQELSRVTVPGALGARGSQVSYTVLRKFREEVDVALKKRGKSEEMCFMAVYILGAILIVPLLCLCAAADAVVDVPGIRETAQEVCNKYNKALFQPKGMLAKAQGVMISWGPEFNTKTCRKYWIALSLDPVDSALLKREASEYRCACTGLAPVFLPQG